MKNSTSVQVIRSSLHTASRAGRVSKRWHLSGIQRAQTQDYAGEPREEGDQEPPDTPSAA